MKEVVFDKGLTIKTTNRVHAALKIAVARVGGFDSVRWKGLAATQEAVVNAAWLWLADLDDAELERVMGHYVGRLEALMTGSPDPGPLARSSPPAAPPVESDGASKSRRGKPLGPSYGDAGPGKRRGTG